MERQRGTERWGGIKWQRQSEECSEGAQRVAGGEKERLAQDPVWQEEMAGQDAPVQAVQAQLEAERAEGLMLKQWQAERQEQAAAALKAKDSSGDLVTALTKQVGQLAAPDC